MERFIDIRNDDDTYAFIVLKSSMERFIASRTSFWLKSYSF